MAKNDVTIEIHPTLDWVRGMHYYSVYVAIKTKYQRYDIGKAKNRNAAYRMAKKWIAANL